MVAEPSYTGMHTQPFMQSHRATHHKLLQACIMGYVSNGISQWNTLGNEFAALLPLSLALASLLLVNICTAAAPIRQPTPLPLCVSSIRPSCPPTLLPPNRLTQPPTSSPTT
jgi:hypothetical protein